MTTANSGLDDITSTSPRRRGRRRRQLLGAALAVATAAAATIVTIGGDVDSAEAQFGEQPPPPSTTLCETDLPSQADNDPAMNWGDPLVNVTIPVVSIDGAAGSATRGAATSYTGDFTYSVVLDNTGDPFDPIIDNHPSYHPMASSSPVVLTGTDVDGDGNLSVDLPRGCRYMVTTRAAGHDLGGAWIRIEADGTTVDASDQISMITNEELPLAQVVVRAFHDYAQTNAQFDAGEYGLAGFDVVLGDGGERSIDYFGNPLCTQYDISGGNPDVLDAADLGPDGAPLTILGGGNCLTDEFGFLTIPYITPGKYELHVIPPDTTDWVQTTTIEGSQIIDAWLVPGDQGLGGEFVGDLGGGTFHAVGFVSDTIFPSGDAADYNYPYVADAAGGDITGCAFNGQIYPSTDGVRTITQNGVENPDGTSEPLFNAYVALNDAGVHDTMMALTETDDNGCFSFNDVPEGSYQLAVWDYELRYIIAFYNLTVDATTTTAPDNGGLANGTVDMGDLFVLRWFGWSSGYVFYDSGLTADGTPIVGTKDGSASTAANGVRDCIGQNDVGFNYDTVDASLCEAGIPEQEILIRNRDGSVFKGGITDHHGYYVVDNIWSPMFRMQVLEVGAGALDFTGHSVHDQFDHNIVASQGNCDAADYTALDGGGGVVSEDCLPAEMGGGLLLASIFQQGKRNEVDFGKLSYIDPNAPNTIFGGDGHGGIAGGVINTVTRAEWAGSLQGAEDNETGVPSTTVTLYGYDTECDAGGTRAGDADPVSGATGRDNPDCYSVALDQTQTDSYQHPGIDRNGQTCTIPTMSAPNPTASASPFQLDNPTFGPVGDNCNGAWLLGAHTKDGAWNGGFAFTGMTPGFYVVEVTPPAGYQIVKENDLNTEEGNGFVPAVPPSGCVGDYHYAQLDEAYGSPYDAFDDGAGGNGSIYNGAAPVRLCDRRLVRVQPFRNVAVDMMLMSNDMATPFIPNHDQTSGPQAPVDPETIAGQAWTSEQTVPVPGRMFGLVLNDLNMTANQNSLTFGEQQGVPNIPIGFYDSAGTLITTIWTDENGHYEVLLPSTYSINRATPGGVGPRMYSVIVNDPGPNGNNWGYDPSFITNPNQLDVWPGTMTKADTPVLSLAAGPCSLPTGTPQLLQVDNVHNTGADMNISGISLDGADVVFTPVNANGTLDTLNAVVATGVTVTSSATPTDPGSFVDVANVPASFLGTLTVGPWQVSFDDGTLLGSSPRNGITFHVLGTGYDLSVTTAADVVDPDDTVIQDAVNAAIAAPGPDGSLVLVPVGTYRESVIIHDDVVVQGYGPGGIIGVGTEIGAIGQVETPYAFLTGSLVSPFGALLDDRMASAWQATADSISWTGNQGVEVGAAFQILLDAGDVAADDNLQIDGIGITSVRARRGAIEATGNAHGLIVSNNGIQANNSSKGGAAITLGAPSVDWFENVGTGGTHALENGRLVAGDELLPTTTRADSDNDGVMIRDNRLLHNGGTTQAGAIGIFNGAENYTVANNDICGNYSAEYGGGITHAGVSNGGAIAGNAIQNNESFDEGGGVMLTSELNWPVGGDQGLGTGSVTVDSNEILYNLSGDDGGGIMVLHSLLGELQIINNVVANNVATDIGGGIHLFDAGNATITHNTIANNMSANSAEDAGGFACNGDVNVGAGLGVNTCPRAGGLTTQPNSGGPGISDPTLQNNIFWNNIAGYVVDGVADDEGRVVQAYTDTVIADLGVYDGTVDLGPALAMNPEYSVLTSPYGASGTNVVGADPGFVAELVTNVKSQPAPALGMAGQIDMVYPGVTPIEAGDYHLVNAGSSAADLGMLAGVAYDIDGQARPIVNGSDMPDAGADEVGEAAVFALMFFSTTRNTDAASGALDTDVTSWTPGGISQVLDTALLGVTSAGHPDAADIDGLHVLSATEFVMSFLGNNVTVPGIGQPVDDEDIVHYDAVNDIWTLAVDGGAIGLTGGARDIDALHKNADGSYLVSFAGFASLPTQSLSIGVPDEDVVRLVPSGQIGGTVVSAYFEPWFSGADIGLDEAGAGDVDGVSFLNGGLLLSIKGRMDVGDLDVRDEDVFYCWKLNVEDDGSVQCDEDLVFYFEGRLDGISGNNDVNAVSGPLG